jgi:F0F1-type ATP synthase assembly protein I
MLNHFKNQRNLSRKLLLAQLLIACGVAIMCSMLNKHAQGLAFAIAALIISVAHYVTARIVFTNRIQAASGWFGRLLIAVTLKWIIVISLFVLFIQQMKDWPLMAILGVIVSLVAIQVFNYLDAKVNRGS